MMWYNNNIISNCTEFSIDKISSKTQCFFFKTTISNYFIFNLERESCVLFKHLIKTLLVFKQFLFTVLKYK